MAAGSIGRQLVVLTSFISDPSVSPQLKRIQSQDERHGIYWKNIAVFLATARRFVLPGAELVCFSPDRPPESVVPVLDSCEVTLTGSEFSFRPPDGFHHSFNGALYLLDAMKWCAETYDEGYDFLFLDPDCLVTDSLDFISNVLDSGDVICYALNQWPAERPNAGLSPIEQMRVAAKLCGAPCEAPYTQYGGEFYAMTYGELCRMIDAVSEAWKANLGLFFDGQSKMNSEEHLISYYLWRQSPRIHLANDRYVKRFWTGWRYRNFQPGDEKLPVWHVPGEKARGMLRIFNDLAANRISLPSMSNAEIKRYLAKQVGFRQAWPRDLGFMALRATGRAYHGIP